MGFDDLSNTGLVLGLGLSSTASENYTFKGCDNHHHQKPKGGLDLEPSLSLGLCGNMAINKVDGNQDADQLCRQDSSISCFTNVVNVKREREIVSEEVEGRVSSRVSDEDEDGSNTRKKLRLSKAQSALLEESFKQHSTLNPKQKQELARELNLRPRQVEVWFQNRRARTKLKQTEVDCEFLKKCCERLTDENRRLQKELVELKALKQVHPSLYMQLPSATLTMCPSCERIGGNLADNNPPKPHFYNAFTNPSAAC